MNFAGSVPSNSVRLISNIDSNIASNITYIRLPRNEHDLATDEIANRNINTLRNGLDCEEMANTIIINNDIQEQRFSIPWHQDQFDDHNNALTMDVYHHNKKRGNTNHKIEGNNNHISEGNINKKRNNNHKIEGIINHKFATKDPNRLVVNLSTFELNMFSRRLLEKGIRFAIATKKFRSKTSYVALKRALDTF